MPTTLLKAKIKSASERGVLGTPHSPAFSVKGGDPNCPHHFKRTGNQLFECTSCEAVMEPEK